LKERYQPELGVVSEIGSTVSEKGLWNIDLIKSKKVNEDSRQILL